MKKQRFKVERSTEGNIFELAFVLLTIVVWVAIVMLYHQAPDIIPTHFGPSGAPDAYAQDAYVFPLHHSNSRCRLYDGGGLLPSFRQPAWRQSRQ